jgi:hypothetical protein
MPFAGKYNQKTNSHEPLKLDKNKKGEVLDEQSLYHPTDEERDTIARVRKAMQDGDIILRTPRLEFDDLSVISRYSADRLAFNTYTPNDGEPAEGDEVNAWRNQSVKPVTRNKCMSIAAHATARSIFPKVYAFDENSDEQKDAAMVMSDLMEWSGNPEQSDYQMTSLNSIMEALHSPLAIVYTEYAEVERTVKTEKGDDGKWKTKKVIDPALSGFKDYVVPVNEFYIPNFYEPNVQKQPWVIMRKVIPFELAKQKYGMTYENFKFVKPGVQAIFNDANNAFYNVYDWEMRGNMVEEVTYWNRSEDLKLIVVNGILLTTCDNPNPRIDKQYPFATFGYSSLGNGGNCAYYKSLAASLKGDDRVINTLYSMVIDGTYMSMYPGLIASGFEEIGSDVYRPGTVTATTNVDAKITPFIQSPNLSAAMNTLNVLNESVSDTVPQDLQQALSAPNQTAFEIAKREQEARTILGLFLKMIMSYVSQYGALRLQDILQYMTIAEVSTIESGQEDLVYKTFLMPDRSQNGKTKTRKIQFDPNLPTQPLNEDEMLQLSMGILKEQGGMDSDMELVKANPELFRELKYKVSVTPDVVNPMSEELERAILLEQYDRAIANPLLDQEAITKDFLLSAYPKSKANVDKYIKKQEDMQQPTSAPQQQMQATSKMSDLTAKQPNNPLL